MIRKSLGLLVTLLVLAACQRDGKPRAPTLLVSEREFSTIAHIEPLLELTSDDPLRLADAALLRQQGLSASGRYEYRLRGPDGGVLTVQVLIHENPSGAQADWRRRHRSESLMATTSLHLTGGAEGWIYPSRQNGEHAAFWSGRVVAEIEARGAGGQLADFTRRMARQAGRLD